MTDTPDPPIPAAIIAKTFDPAEIEARLYAHWEATGGFRPYRPDARPFTIVIPPPNVTGSLHLGHALDNTLQDVLIRYHRLKGRDALWVVGTDHAGIATQMVVERTIAAQGLKRTDMSRDAFLAHVWEWKEQSGGAITRQLRRLGASCDWAHERFTMDKGFSAAVTKVFVALYNQGLITRAKRLVNWDPRLGTAISDLEVEPREVQGSFTHIRYPLADGVRLADGADHIVVATTRPETMLGDTAVAVNPTDPRYQSVVGQHIVLPLTGRRIPIIADDHADPELGSGAVKITPAHDFNDWAVYERHREIGWINILDAEANIVAADGVPERYVGLTREDARKAVVADLDAAGLIELVEAKTIQMPYGDRSGVVIEPWLTDQWYVDAKTLAGPAIEAVRTGKTKFVPANWDKTYFNWMESIQPWCVSRQITWGHRIPAWYAPDGTVHVAATEAEAQALAGPGGPLRQDNDVLDTWFSSALWPFATLGWPAGDARVARYYPGDVLVTGFDIIFFWVARMMMQGLHFMGEVPFATVYCHGLVRDAKGAKMSKSKGNTVDPLALIDRYGADALRFTLTAMESQGRDIKLDEKRVEGYRNFATKLWNAARFCQSNGIIGSTSAAPPDATTPVNRWIVGEVVATARALDVAIAAFRFDGYAETAYQFVWSRFCDWYLELTKPLLAEGADAAVAAETRAVTGWALDQILVMLHPVMPFLTEELWHKLGSREHDLIVAVWPVTDERVIDETAKREISRIIEIIGSIRSQRLEVEIPPSAVLPCDILMDQDNELPLLNRYAGMIGRLARLQPGHLETVDHQVDNSGYQVVFRTGHGFGISKIKPAAWRTTYQMPVGGLIFVAAIDTVVDSSAAKARLEKNALTAEKERDALTSRLASPGFIDKAKPEAVDKARADLAARTAEAGRLRAALARLG